MVGFFVKTSFSWNYEHERGLSIQEHYTVRGITLDRPKQKENGQFATRDADTNFDIAAIRIHVESFMERVRDWEKLSSIWLTFYLQHGKPLHIL